MAIAGTGYEVMLSGLSAGFLAQLIKMIFSLIQRKPINFRLLVSTGGMPSSHSSSMTGTATSVGLITGFDSVIFAVAFALALIVMYDAAGVRRAAGLMASVLNKVTEDFYMDRPAHLPERLRELLGHTPIEVVAGGLLGFLVAWTIHYRLML
jgi:acid phosphatase family membrane protein YuiD